MKKSISNLYHLLVFNVFLMLMPLAAILDMTLKMDFSNFRGNIQHGITMLHFANCFVKAGKNQQA